MKHGRDFTTLGMWTVYFSNEPRCFEKKSEVARCLSELLCQFPSGRIDVDEDIGGRSWLARFVLGLSPRLLQMHFAIEWYDSIASLIFFDDAVSEYRAKDVKRPIQANEETRKAIAHGELAPHPVEQCMALDRAEQAIKEYMEFGSRPDWLEYEYVA